MKFFNVALFFVANPSFTHGSLRSGGRRLDPLVGICTGEPHGTVIPIDNCQNFVTCAAGFEPDGIVQPCPPGLLYDVSIGVCNFADQVPCGTQQCVASAHQIGNVPIGTCNDFCDTFCFDQTDRCTIFHEDDCEENGCRPVGVVDCNDGDMCNGIESCDPLLGCIPGTAPVCSDGNICNGIESCDPSTGCQAGTPLLCDDGDMCNGIESCDPLLGCIPGTAPVCSDGNICNGVESCDPSTGCQAGTPLLCDDGDMCNGIETCNPVSGCVPGVALNCDDGLSCTVDSCDGLTGCVNEPIKEFNVRQIKVEGDQGYQNIDSTEEAYSLDTTVSSLGPVSISTGNAFVSTFFEGFVDSANMGGGGGNFGTTQPYPVPALRNFLVSLRATVTIPAGTWTMFIASDDGRILQMPGITFDGVSGQTSSIPGLWNGLSGTDTIGFNAPSAHNNSRGRFTVAATTTVELYGMFWERDGGDSFELAICSGDCLSGGTAPFQILKDGTFGWEVSACPLAP